MKKFLGILAAFFPAFFGCVSANAQLHQFLTPAELNAYTTTYPPEVQSTTWAPVVTDGWWQSQPTQTILNLGGTDGFGSPPWLLGSPTAFPTTPGDLNPNYVHAISNLTRVGYFPLYGGQVSELGAFIAILPPDFTVADGHHISRVVAWIGSGDNRARSITTEDDVRGFSPAGVLFVAFDLRTISLTADVPGSPGPRILSKGLDYVLRTLHISNSVPVDLAGFSAGGGGTLYAAMEDDGLFQAAVAMAPTILPWDAFDQSNFLTPADPFQPWARTFSFETADPMFFANYYGNGTIGPLVRYIFGDERTYNKAHPLNRLVQGEKFKQPLLIVAGTQDEFGTREVTTVLGYANAWRDHSGHLTKPIVYSSADQSAGRTVDFDALAAAMHDKGSVATLLIDGATHTPVTSAGDMRQIMLDFFAAVSRSTN